MFVENKTDGFDASICKLVYGFRERLQISENSLIETVQNSSAWRSSRLLKFFGEVLIFAINHDFQCTNAVIKIMVCFFLHLFFIFCDVGYYIYLYISARAFFFQLSIINEIMNLRMRKTDVSSVFSSFLYAIFNIFCKLFLLYLLYMGSMFKYISLNILWKPAIKTIIIIIKPDLIRKILLLRDLRHQLTTPESVKHSSHGLCCMQ